MKREVRMRRAGYSFTGRMVRETVLPENDLLYHKEEFGDLAVLRDV